MPRSHGAPKRNIRAATTATATTVLSVVVLFAPSVVRSLSLPSRPPSRGGACRPVNVVAVADRRPLAPPPPPSCGPFRTGRGGGRSRIARSGTSAAADDDDAGKTTDGRAVPVGIDDDDDAADRSIVAIDGREDSPVAEETTTSSSAATVIESSEEEDDHYNDYDPSVSVVACAALVAGTTVGAGIIALPAKTLSAGFVPTALILALGWAYMASTGLLIAEVNVNTLCILEERSVRGGLASARRQRGAGVVSINTMAEETLGPFGATASSLAFGFLHYALLTAYTIQGGALLGDVVRAWGEESGGGLSFVDDIAVVLPGAFASLLGLVLFGLRPRTLERLNTSLVLLVVASFVGLLTFGIPKVDASLLRRADYGAVVDALPLMPVVYVYQTVVPTLCTLLRCDAAKIRTAVVAGTGVPLLMFLSWSAVILGTVPYDPSSSAVAGGGGGGGVSVVVDPLEALRSSGSLFGDTVLAFSLLAVATSFVGFAYGLVDFYADVLSWESPLSGGDATEDSAEVASDEKSNTGGEAISERSSEDVRRKRRWILAALTVLPPVTIATLDPTLFFSALDNAGTYGILVLFGLLPAAMAWSQRYGDDDDDIEPSEYAALASGDREEYIAPDALVPGGRASLGTVFLTAVGIIALETYEKFESSSSSIA